MKNILEKTKVHLMAAAIILSTVILSCSSPEQKVENADSNVTEAKENLEEAQNDYSAELEKFKKETNEKITSNEELIAGIKADMANDKRAAREEYKKQIEAIEQKNADLKKRINEYKEDGSGKWESFKEEFNRDMQQLGQSLKDLTVDNKK